MKKIKNNGFTLVELVATIAIMLLIVTIAVPSTISLISKSEEKSRNNQIAEFESAAESYVLDNNYRGGMTPNTTYCVSLADLNNENYIKEIPNDPETDNKFTGKVEVKKDSNGKVTYKYNSSSCTSNLVSSITPSNEDDEDITVPTNPGGDNVTNVAIGNFVDTVYGNNIYNENMIIYNQAASIPGLYQYKDGYVFRGLVNNNHVKIDDLNLDWRIVEINNNYMKLISNEALFESSWCYSCRVIDGKEGIYDQDDYRSQTYRYMCVEGNYYSSNTDANNALDYEIPAKEYSKNLEVKDEEKEHLTFSGGYNLIFKKLNEYKNSNLKKYIDNGILVEGKFYTNQNSTFSPSSRSTEYSEKYNATSYSGDIKNIFDNCEFNSCEEVQSYIGLPNYIDVFNSGMQVSNSILNVNFSYLFDITTTPFWGAESASMTRTREASNKPEYYIPRIASYNVIYTKSSDCSDVNSVRPIIYVSRDAIIETGNGTINNPYIITAP